MTAVAIVNPVAGAGAARARWLEASRLLAAKFAGVETHFTAAPGQATELARRAVDSGAELLIAAGGDGTVNEVLNGMLPRGGVRLGVLPLASGGDLGRSLGLKGLRHAVETLAAGQTQAVDVLRVRCASAHGMVERYCLNEASAGLGAVVTGEVRHRWRVLPGRLRYVAEALRQLARGVGYELRVSLDGGAETEWTLATLALANGRYQGGGMHIAPRASIADGLIDLTFIERLSLREALPHLHLLYTAGIYRYRKVHHLRAKHVRVEGPGQTLVEIDGDPAGWLPLEVEVLPGAVQIIAPRPSGA